LCELNKQQTLDEQLMQIHHGEPVTEDPVVLASLGGGQIEGIAPRRRWSYRDLIRPERGLACTKWR
jgi:hypothetical protein